MSETILSIAICSYNRASFIKENLAFLLRQIENLKLYEQIEILIINNNSTDDTDQIPHYFSHFNQIRIETIFEKQPGLCFARNCAIQKAKGEFIFFLDDDAYVHEHWLSSVMEVLENHESILTVGGPIYPNFEAKILPWWVDQKDFIRLRGFSNGSLPDKRARYGFNGGNMGFKKAALIEVGKFDSQFNFKNSSTEIILGEENDIALRIYNRFGNKTYYHEHISVSHFEPIFKTSLKGYIKRFTASGKSIFSLHLIEHKGIPHHFKYSAALLLYGLYRVLLGLIFFKKYKPSTGIIRLAQFSTYFPLTLKLIWPSQGKK